MSTFFAVRDEIAEKLKEIPEFLRIYTPLNSVSVTEMSQVTPSAHVNFVRIDKRQVQVVEVSTRSVSNGRLRLHVAMLNLK